MASKKNILISQIHMEVGGIETVLLNLLNSLDKEKYNIDLILYYPKGDFLEKIPDWINVIPIWNETKHQNFWKNIVLSRNFIKRILKNIFLSKFTVKHFIPKKEYDVSISFSGYHVFSNCIAAKANSKKKLIWVHTDFARQYELRDEFKKQFTKIYKQYKYFDKIICVSESVCENFKTFKPELKDKLDYCWNIVKERTYPETNENFVLKNGFNFITVSRLVKTKGFDRLIDLAKLLKENNIKCNLYIAGDGPLRPWIEEQIITFKLEDIIILLGKVINLPPVFKQCNAYLSPSDLEGLPTTIIESLIMGIPVIATPIAGSIDVYKYMAPENSMLLADDMSTESLYKVVLSVINDKTFKPFSFDINKVNSQTLERFEILINN